MTSYCKSIFTQLKPNNLFFQIVESLINLLIKYVTYKAEYRGKKDSFLNYA